MQTPDDSTPAEAKRYVASVWAPVLAFELEHGKPKGLIVLGKTRTLPILKRLVREERIRALPGIVKPVDHYSYVMSSAQGTVGPGDARRVAAWRQALGEAARAILSS